jgi:hypothetical protein
MQRRYWLLAYSPDLMTRKKREIKAIKRKKENSTQRKN